jgi:hypothetical protein
MYFVKKFPALGYNKYTIWQSWNDFLWRIKHKINTLLMSAPEGNGQFCFFPHFVSGIIEIRGEQNYIFRGSRH